MDPEPKQAPADDDRERPGEGRILAAVVLAVVSLLLIATLPASGTGSRSARTPAELAAAAPEVTP